MSRLAEAVPDYNSEALGSLMKALGTLVERRVPKGAFSEYERVAIELSNEAVRRLLERRLQEIADKEHDEVELNGGTFRRHHPGTVEYHSLCGTLRNHRWTYREVGVRNGPTIVPLELRAGLIARATPAFAYAVAQGYAKAPMRHVEQDMRAAGRVPPSRSTLERMAKAIGAATKEQLFVIEQHVRANEKLPEAAHAVTIGLDRTTIPMEEELQPGEHVERRLRRSTTKRRRKRPKPVAIRYRMAYVGTVALTDRRGEVLLARRYAAAAHEGPHSVLERMMADLRRILRVKPKLHLGIVQDGAPEMWNLLRDVLEDEHYVRRWHEVVDMYHLFERLAAALEVVEPDASARTARLVAWKKEFLRDDSTIHRVLAFFNQKTPWLRGQWSEQQQDQLDKILTPYLLVISHFQYGHMVRRGLHVGSGITEGACKSLIAARAKRGGQRWKPQGVDAVLTLRSLVHSERFEPFWRRFASSFAPLAQAA